jgi:hypothetical protein
MRRRQHCLQVEGRIGDRAHRGDDHGEVLGAGAGERGVDGNHLDRRQPEAWSERGDELIARAAPASQHARHALGRRRQHRKTVAPAAIEREPLEIVEVVGRSDAVGNRRSRSHRGRPVARQRREDVIEERVGPAPHHHGFEAADRVGDNHMREMRHPFGDGCRARERRERVRPDDDRGDPASLQRHRVVDTPRRARPSIRGAGEHDVDGSRDLVVVRGGT